MSQSAAPPVRHEIERKFVVTGDGWRPAGRSYLITQGYVARRDRVEVRLRETESAAYLTLKARQPDSRVRVEYEYEIPREDARAMLEAMCEGALIRKTRHVVHHAGHEWEVDVFEGENAGLVTAEIELSEPDEEFNLPDWVGCEVTDDSRYSNAALCDQPFSCWKKY